MSEYWYLDIHGQVLGSVQAFSFRDAHAWLARQNIRYHTITLYPPRVTKKRARRIEKRARMYGQMQLL